MRRHFKRTGRHDLDGAAEAFTPELRFHGLAPQPLGRDGWTRAIAGFLAAFPDARFVVDDVIAEGDKVAVRHRLRGTHRGAFQGIPPTGTEVEVGGIVIYRVAGGKLAEGWLNADFLGLLQQLGGDPPAGAARGLTASPELERALAGRVGAHQRFLLARQLAHMDFLDERVAEVSAEIARRLAPHEAALERLATIPGVGRRTAEVLVAEIGTDMGRFPTAGHLASWAGMCPGNNESAGKRRGGATGKGSPWLRAALIEAAQAARRARQTHLGARSGRPVARRGKKRGAVAVGRTILTIAYHLLRDGSEYHDRGPRYFDERDRQAVERRLVGRLQGLGYKVSLEPAA